MSEETPAKPEHLATLYQVTRTLNSSLDLDEVLNEVMDRVIEVTGAERGFLMLREDDGQLAFKVARGLGQQDLEDPEFKVSMTIVRRVEETGQPLLTDNAQFDERIAMGKSIVALGLRSILCVPIYVKDRMIGLVYVDNRLQAGVFNEDDLDLLVAFAFQAGIAIENARLYQVAVEKGRMESELRTAHNIQLSLLPRTEPELPGYDMAAAWHSALEVAGDFYDFIRLDAEHVGVVIADVSDKGVPAALFMAVARSLIRGNAVVSASPVETLATANRLILSDARSNMFVTVYYAIFGPRGHAVGVNAGHNRPLIYRAATDTIEFLPRGGLALGWFEEIPLEPVEIKLEPGDVMVFYTDGITEAENSLRVPFGQERLAQAVREAAGLPAKAILNHIDRSVKEFVGDMPPFDDSTMVVVRYTG